MNKLTDFRKTMSITFNFTHTRNDSQNSKIPFSFIRQAGCARNVKDSILRVTGKEYRLGIHNSQPAEKAADAPKKDPLQNLISRARDMGVNVDFK